MSILMINDVKNIAKWSSVMKGDEGKYKPMSILMIGNEEQHCV